MVGSALRGEKLRGFVTSIVSASVAGGFKVIGTNLGMDPTLSSLLFVYLLGNSVAYVGDIMFAKERFGPKDGGGKETHIPYSAYMQRFMWLLHSFTDKYFYRFVVTVVVDTLVGIALIRASIDFLDDHEVLTDFKWRDLFVTGLVSVITFFLYTNVLRFDWAYRSDTDVTTDMVILIGMVVILMVFAQTYRRDKDSKKSTESEELPSDTGHVIAEILNSKK